MRQPKHYINRVLSRIASGELSRTEAATQANVSVRTINRWIKRAGVRRPKSKSRRKRELIELRRKQKKSVIISTYDSPAHIPAQLLDVSVRTVYRLRKKYKAEINLIKGMT